MEYDAIVLAGGRATRLDGADKAAVEVDGRRLLDRALDAVVAARTVVVVGDAPSAGPAPASEVRWTRERPAYGGPVAATYAGLDALHGSSPLVVVLAVDMPGVTDRTVARLVGAAEGRDGAVLTAGGRRHLAFAVRATALDDLRPVPADGVAMRELWARLDLAEVPGSAVEGDDIDTWADLAGGPDRGVGGGPG